MSEPVQAPFPYERLRRYPDVEAANLYAADAADRYLVDTFAEQFPGATCVVLDDAYGALSLPLAHGAQQGSVRVYTDLCTSSEAIAANAVRLGLEHTPEQAASLADAVTGAHHILMRLPRSLDALDEYLTEIARHAVSDVVVLAGGRIKHMSPAMNQVFERHFGSVQVSLARQKSRIITAREPREAAVPREYPLRAMLPELGMEVAAHGGVFAGAKLDIGTRDLLRVISELPNAATVLDLGCGTGVLATQAALREGAGTVIASDRSRAAVASAAATATLNGAPVQIDLSDAGSDLPDGVANVILLNPPFHAGAAVHADVALKLFDAASRLLAPGGDVFTVFNRHLNYTAQLDRRVGATAVLSSSGKFVITRSHKDTATTRQVHIVSKSEISRERR